MLSKFSIALASTVLLFALIAVNHNPFSFVEKPLNRKLWEMKVVSIVDAVGPDSVAFNPLGDDPYARISDGWTIK